VRRAGRDHREAVFRLIDDAIEDHRKLARLARRGEPAIRRVLRQPQFLLAVGAHARVSRRQVELARIDLGDVGEHRGSRAALLCDQ